MIRRVLEAVFYSESTEADLLRWLVPLNQVPQQFGEVCVDPPLYLFGVYIGKLETEFTHCFGWINDLSRCFG